MSQLSRKTKDSGIKWIGEIPEDWEVTSVKSRYKLVTGFTPDTGNLNYYDDNGYVWVNISDLSNERYIYDSKKKISKLAVKECKGNLIKKGSLLYSFKLSVGQVAFAGNDLYTNEAIASFIEDESINLNFFYYMSSFAIIQNANENIYGAKLLNQQLIKNAKIVFPPLNEQQAISNFLDQKVSEIDHILKKTRESIEEYKKYKQSLITEAVTKGLNPDVEMKDSGIEWIGEIPKHWEVERIKNNFTVLSGATPKSENSEYWDGDITWATPADYKTEDVYIFNTKRTITEEGLSSCGTNLVPKDSIIVSNRAPIGAIALAGVELCTNQGCKALVRKKNISTKFIYYYLSVMSSPLNMLGRGTTFMELSTSDLNNLYIPIGPIDEQYKIIDYLDSKCIGIYKLIYKKRQLLSDLETYKKSLIYECVTGKREVD